MTQHTLSLGPLSLLATQTGPLLTITIHAPSDSAPVGKMTLTVPEWTALVAMVDSLAVAGREMGRLRQERDEWKACAARTGTERRSDEMRAIHDANSLRQQVRELTEENERLRKEPAKIDAKRLREMVAIRANTIDGCVSLLSSELIALLDEMDRLRIESASQTAAIAELVKNAEDIDWDDVRSFLGMLKLRDEAAAERDQARSDLSAALVSVDAMAKRLEQLQPIVSVLGDWDWQAIRDEGCWRDDEYIDAMRAAVKALAHTASEQGKEKDNG